MIRFGSIQHAIDGYQKQRRGLLIESILRDARYGLRGLRRSPGFTAVAIVTLAIAIGANTAIFTLLSQTLFRALPVVNAKQLVVLSFAGDYAGHLHSDGGDTPGHQHYFSYPMYHALRANNTAFQGLIASALSNGGVAWNNRAESVPLELVSGNYFEVLGVRPALGRLFVSTDETAENADPVAVLNFDYWKTHLGGAPVIGKTLHINGSPFTIIGVTSPNFHSVVWGRLPNIYVPLTMQRVITPNWNYLGDPLSYWLNIVGRLRLGDTAKQASAAANPLFNSLRASEFVLQPDQSAKDRVGFVSRAHLNLEFEANGFSPLRDNFRTPLVIIMGMVLLFMSMAVVNIASLLLVRAATRVREFSLRYALGATYIEVLRQLLIEGLLLGTGGAVIGIGFAPQALRVLIRWISGRSRSSPFSPNLDWHVLLFSTAITFSAILLFSLVPGMRFRNPHLNDAIKSQTGTHTGSSLRLRRTCVALQIGFSLMLIVSAGLFVRTIHNLRNVNVGFPTDHLLTFGLAAPTRRLQAFTNRTNGATLP